MSSLVSNSLFVILIISFLCLNKCASTYSRNSYYYPTSSRLVEGSSADTAGCPLGYTKYGQTCLKMSQDFASHPTAEAMCEESGGRLATPKNWDAHSNIRRVAETSRTASYWIGLKKVKGIWTFSDKTPVSSYVQWFIGHPILGQDHDCAVMSMRSNHTWLSAGCKWAWRYVCQIDLEPIDEPSSRKSGCDPNELGLYNMFIMTTLSSPSVYNVGSVMSAECLEGHSSKKPVTVECMPTNAWEAQEPCLKLCPTPVIPSPLVLLNASASQSFTTGDKVLLGCQNGYMLKNENNITCLANGTWSTTRTSCIKQKEDKKNDPKEDDNKNKGVKEEKNVRSEECPHWPSTSEGGGLPIVTDTEYLREGQSLLISCLQHYRIEPRSLQANAKEWTWMKEQHIIDGTTDSRFPNVKVDETGSLMILRMSKELEGLYTCISYVDEEREVTFRSVHIALKRNCSMELDIKPKDTVIFDGGYAILRCYAHNATVTWSKGTVPLGNKGNHRVLPNGALLIMNAQASDTGTYQCTAQHVQTRCQVSHSASVEIESALEEICGKPMTHNTIEEEDRGKIVGGEEVEKGSHPWIALIVGDIPRPNRKPSKVFCGGSLVNNFWVLSAAHCFRAIKQQDDIAHLKIRLGKHDRTMTERDERVFGIQKAVVHPYFDEDSFDNDIAMLKLSDRVYYSNYILPVCLPYKGFMAQYTESRMVTASGFVAGWGQLKEAGLQPSELRAVQLPLISDDICKKSTAAVVTGNMFCAGYNLSTGDACKGDSGGPFEMAHKGRAYLAGVVSWGEGCARPAKYGFYVKVEKFIDFIAAQIAE